MRRLAAAATLLLLTPLPAQAGRPDAYMCRNGFFAGDDQTVALMRVVGRPRVFFLWDRDTKGCPADVKACRQSYVLPGQEVLAGKSANGFICAFCPSAHGGGGSAGWVVASKLAPEPKQPDPPLKAWAGRWRDGDSRIKIVISGALLRASGKAIWHGGGDDHLGWFDAQAKPGRAAVVFVEQDCTVTAKLLGRYLIVADNSGCGALNVRFDGIYRRKR